MEKSKSERAEALEEHKNKMLEMTPEELNERNQRFAKGLRRYFSKMSDKERNRFHKKLQNGLKSVKIKKLTKKMLKEAKQASKLAE
jgi:catalase